MSDDTIIPFGKYKGKPVTEIAQRDPQYLAWLGQQDWARNRFPEIFSITINNFATEPQDTPEHNALQLRFLDQKFQTGFVSVLLSRGGVDWGWRQHEDHANSSIKFQQDILAMTEEELKEEAKRMSKRRHIATALYGIEERTEAACLKELSEAPQKLLEAQKHLESLQGQRFAAKKVKFEDGSDVVLDIFAHNGPVRIEIKVSLGDDFPAVLRQMLQQKSSLLSKALQNSSWEVRRFGSGMVDTSVYVLLYADFAATASLDQVTDFFATRNIILISVAEIEAAMAL